MTKLNTNRTGASRIVLVAWLLLAVAIPTNRAFSTDERQLSFYHTHTRETLNITYSSGGEYLQPALQRINKFLLDFRTGGETLMDPELLDLLYDARQSLGSEAIYEIISAYRSPTTNQMLRDKSNGVAKNSQHLLGKAIDVRLRGTDSADLRDAAIALQRGGVGYYSSSDFVHMDTGRVRRW